MLNWAARYFPIVRALRTQLSGTESVLEVGCGPFGIGRFLGYSFVGCDVEFPIAPGGLMLPVRASAISLPFEDRSFDGVVLSDVLEHIPAADRTCTIQEALRVARRVAIFGFPSGRAALEYDLKLAEYYDRTPMGRPEWMKEHIAYQPYPSEELFEELRKDWIVSSFDNENAAFHNWVMRQETRRLGMYCFRILLRLMPRTTEYLLRQADQEPYYRKIVVVRRPS